MNTTEQCVIYNPAAGHGLVARRIEGLRQALGPRAEFRPTTGPGHAEELACAAARQGFPMVGAAGGDGTLHEVANGVLRAGTPDTALAVYPIGSANDYAHSLGLQREWWARPGTTVSVRPVDVGRVLTPGGRERFFVNALGVGLIGAVNLESRRVGRLRGLARYMAGLLRALWSHYHHPLMSVTTDGHARTTPTLGLSIAIGKREGNFMLAPRAEVDDGLFDYLHGGSLSRWQLLGLVPGAIWGRLPANHPQLWIGRCRQLTLSSEAPLIAHVDGEFLTLPEQNVRTLEVQILPGRLRVQAANGP
jgi:diacylglycerol kinase (ATP)